MRIDATLTGNYAIMGANLWIGSIMEACSQARIFEYLQLYDWFYELYFGEEFVEPTDTIISYEDIDGVVRAVSHVCEYIPVSNIFV